MRVITGTAKGKRLVTPEGREVTRPTGEKVKEGIFSSIQFLIEGADVLDLFDLLRIFFIVFAPSA